MKTFKEIALGALKVIGYVVVSAAITASIGYLGDTLKTLEAQSVTYLITNVVIYILIQLRGIIPEKK